MECESQKINILMVDDNPANLLSLEAILQAPDRNLVRAASGNDALRYLLDCDVSVILLDVNMPGLDGLETAALIRNRERSRDIPIIFLTADRDGRRHVAKGYSLGAVDYILKPIEPDILRSKVAVFVELFRRREEVKRQAELLREQNIELENANLQRLGRLVELGQELAAERDPSRVLEKFCHTARSIVGAEQCCIAVIEGEQLCEFSHHSRGGPRPPETCAESQLPQVPQEIIDRLMSERRPLRLDRGRATTDGEHQSFQSLAVASFLGAPIFLSEQVFGWMCLIDKFDADEFSDADERLVGTLATQVAVAYENARLYAEAQRHARELRQEVAERKQAEEERARLLVLERAARAEAEAANRAKDEFLATISHELRTPLTAILGWIHLIRSDKLDDSMTGRAFETIERNARAQSQLIDDLLDVSRIITGKLRIDLRPVDLAQIVESAADTIRPTIEAKQLRLDTVIEVPRCLVNGDSDRLQQIAWNLFSNAVKFTSEGGQISIRLSCHPAHVRLEVRDTGQGISPEFLPHIFDRFRQADGTTTRKHGGLGLGLAIVRHLAELHGGAVGVHSDGLGHGSTFTVELPVLRKTEGGVRVEEEKSAIEGAASRNPPSAILKGVGVLVVDDEADTRELVCAILTQFGAEVRASESAAAALRALDEWQPDVLLSDIGMPGEDGYEFIRKVRQLDPPPRGRLPAVALTAYATVEDHARALEAGFQTHVAKPVDPQD
ncbi:MAG: response regulator, partial [Acidobacteriota bacterium]|nr:response regulator [Acidobacteriota bacterium]